MADNRNINLLNNGEFTSRDVTSSTVGELRNELDIPASANVNVGGVLFDHLHLLFGRGHSVGANQANQAQSKRDAKGTVERVLRGDTVGHSVAYLWHVSLEQVALQVVLRSHLCAALGHNDLALYVDATV